MAIIRQGILGGFKNKIGSVVGSAWKGRAVMRAKPLSVANPRTGAQVGNRKRFAAIAELASEILAPIIKPLMDRFAGDISGYNMFCQVNKNNWVSPAGIKWDLLKISKGRMVEPDITQLAVTPATAEIEWRNTVADRYGMLTDKVYALIVETASSKVLYAGDTGAKRQDGIITLPFSETTFAGANIRVFLAFLREDNTEVSNTATDLAIV